MKIILSSFEEFEVTATVGDGAEALAYCLEHEGDVDIALLDVRMPNMNGVEATREIAARTSVKPLILTTFDDDEFVLEAVKAGARGYLLKNNDPERIRDAIKSVHNNHHVLQDVILEKIKSNLNAYSADDTRSASLSADSASDTRSATHSPDTAAEAGSHVSSVKPVDSPLGQPVSPVARDAAKFDRSLFTERELGVMEQIALGLSNKEISKKLFLSEGTTANYITSILNKTGLEHRTQIAIYVLTGETRFSGK